MRSASDQRVRLRNQLRVFKVTWTPDSPGAIGRLEYRGNLSSLESRFPGFAARLEFQPHQTHEMYLTTQGAAHIASLTHYHVELRGDGSPVNASEQQVLDALSARETSMFAAEREIHNFLEERGDYHRAALVSRLLSLSDVRPDHVAWLGEFEVLSAEECDRLRTIVTKVAQIRKELELKGWRFEGPGKVYEPPNSRKPVRFPGSLIRAIYRSVCAREECRGSGEDIVTYIQKKLPPALGEVPKTQIRIAIKYEPKQRDERKV